MNQRSCNKYSLLRTVLTFFFIIQQYLRPVGEINDEGPDVDCFKFGISESTTGKS
jgi:hypothetical protein